MTILLGCLASFLCTFAMWLVVKATENTGVAQWLLLSASGCCVSFAIGLPLIAISYELKKNG
mgnify:CR=1 FL=1